MIRRFILRWATARNHAHRLTVAGRLPVVRTSDELEELISRRHAKGDAARKGHITRRSPR